MAICKKTAAIKAASALLAFACVFCFALPVNAAQAPLTQGRVDAANYAYKYWDVYNNAQFYNSTSANCANFVSQCLYAGGIPTDSTWYCAKQSNGKLRGSSAWMMVDSLLSWLRSTGRGEIIAIYSKKANAPAVNYELQVGDVVFYDWYGDNSTYDFDHVAIVTNVDGGLPKVCQNTTDRLNKKYNSGYTSTRIMIVRVHY